MEYLEFEKPIQELMLKLEQAQKLKEEGIDASQAIHDLNKKIEKQKNEIYTNLNAWQKVQL